MYVYSKWWLGVNFHDLVSDEVTQIKVITLMFEIVWKLKPIGWRELAALCKLELLLRAK